MVQEQKNSARPVVGEEVGRSIVKTIGYIVFLIFLFCFGLLLIWGWWTEFVFPGDKQVTWWGIILGVLVVLAGPFLIIDAVHRLFSRERLVFGMDRLQLVRKKDSVVVQIPYRNIADISYEVTEAERLLHIDLIDLKDPDTFGDDFESNKTTQNWHYTIGGGFKVGVSALHKKLLKQAGMEER